MSGREDLFERLADAISGGNPLDMSVRELRACANLLEMHVAEETPDPQIVDDLHRLLTRLADLRGLPPERRPQLEAAIHDIRRSVFP